MAPPQRDGEGRGLWQRAPLRCRRPGDRRATHSGLPHPLLSLAPLVLVGVANLR
jgi:hypothetical protein